MFYLVFWAAGTWLLSGKSVSAFAFYLFPWIALFALLQAGVSKVTLPAAQKDSNPRKQDIQRRRAATTRSLHYFLAKF